MVGLVRGSLREVRPGYWQLRVSLGRDQITGKSRYRTAGVRGTKREAERALAALVTDVANGKRAPSAETVGTLLDQWLEHLEHQGRSPTTMNGYRSLRSQLPEDFLRRPLRKVTPKVIDDLYRRLGQKEGRSASTVHHFHRLLRGAFNQAMRWEMLDRNPATLATPPKPRPIEPEPPTAEEVRRVIAAAAASQNPENALIFRLMAATGCRRGELCALRWTDLNLKTGEAVVRESIAQVSSELFEKDTKAHQQRTVTLDAGTVDSLKDHLGDMKARAKKCGVPMAPRSFVFSDAADGADPIPPDRLTQAWRRIADSVNVDARLHDLRHLQASLLLDAGESVTTVAARLGHRDTSTTLRVYAHLMPGADQRAAEIVGDMFEALDD
jgi:integrase